MAFREEVSAHLGGHGFVASNRDAPFKSARGELFDRPSPANAHLIECIDIERDRADRSCYRLSSHIALASAYDLPAFVLMLTGRNLHADGMFYPAQREGGRLFSDSDPGQLSSEIDSVVLPSFVEQSNLEFLRDLYLFIGGYTLRDRNLERFRDFGMSPSRRHLREPRIIMVLEGLLGDLKRALKFLNEHGVVGSSWSEFELDLSEVSEDDRRGLSASEIFSKYSKRKSGDHWTVKAKRDLECGTFASALAVDVLCKFRRLQFPSGYQPL